MRIAQLAKDLVDFCYPQRCIVCAGELDGDSFCAGCKGKIDTLASAPACGRCAMPVAEKGAPCPYCFGDGLKPFDLMARLSIYVDPIKELIHRMKYQRDWNIAEILAPRMLQHPGITSILKNAEVIIPIPLHPLRQISRGFNQAEVLARALKKAHRHLKIAFPAVRLKHTETQTHLTKSSRLENLQDAFGVIDSKSIVGKRVALVDDVLTTGATLQSFARTLKPASYASISAITIAIADPKNRDFQAV